MSSDATRGTEMGPAGFILSVSLITACRYVRFSRSESSTIRSFPTFSSISCFSAAMARRLFRRFDSIHVSVTDVVSAAAIITAYI
ncbi:unnamed protein product [Linum trigynum]|uniref:Uncharacterized protein n=1 Tax=Linum trigynum TaxID=586398 RepID=A0AAV2FH96_9ROSI